MGFAWIGWFELTDEEYKTQLAERRARSSARTRRQRSSNSSSRARRASARSLLVQADWLAKPLSHMTTEGRMASPDAMARAGSGPRRPLDRAARSARAQQNEIDNNFKFNSGQDVQPVFEGWSHAPDGGFAMHFGYLNRNWVQELSIPVGPANNIEPGGPDRGQPTFFYTRTQRNMFTVNVPKDWGKKELIWTITANGKTQKAIGWLQPEWEIDPAGGASTGGRTDQEARKNKPPTLTIDGAVSGDACRLRSRLTPRSTDDGLPKPTAGRAQAGDRAGDAADPAGRRVRCAGQRCRQVAPLQPVRAAAAVVAAVAAPGRRARR